MKKFLLLMLATVFVAFNIKGQQIVENDTANYPYWIYMMQDRSINFYQTQSAFEKYWENREVTKSSGWKQYKRWEWEAQQVIDIHGNFPNEEIQYRDFMQMLQKTEDDKYGLYSVVGAPCGTQGDWKELGPVYLPQNNTNQMNGLGRLNAIALHPTDTNTFYAGSCAGGFWTSKDGGKTWSVYKDSLPTLGVSSIAVNPNNPDTLYFGSGDRDHSSALGFGVFRSINSGESWVRMNTGMGNQTVGKLIIDPNNTNVLLAATNNGVYRSTNAAGNWTRTLTSTNTKDIVFKPNNSNHVYTTRVGLFYRSTNNGVTWTQITEGLPTTGVSRGVITVSPLDSNLVYFWIANGNVHKGFYLSRDGGTSFTTMSTTPNIHANTFDGSGTSGQGAYNKTMVVDPTDAGIIYCGGVNIFKSTDTGKTWSMAGYWVSQVHADHHDMVACPITNRVFTANDGGLYYTRTKGTPWIPVKSGLAIAQIYNIGASRTQKDILITGFQDNGTANYNPNNNWVTTRGGDGMDCAVDQEDYRYSYGELYYGQIFRVFNVNQQSTIAGNNINGITESGAWNTPFTLREGLSTTMYIGYKNIWRSSNIRDFPPTWTKITNNLGGVSNSNFHAIESCIANSNILYASRSNNTFYISENVNDENPSWNAITQPATGLVRKIETDPESENIVYISITNRVYKSYDKGATWTQINGNLPFNVNAILLDTSSSKKGLYVGTFGAGVWYTDSTLNSWIYYSKGIPYTSRVTDLEMYYDSDKESNILYASTYNRGVWYSNVYPENFKKPIADLDPSYNNLACLNSVIDFKNNSRFNPTAFEWIFDKEVSYKNGTDSSFGNPSILFSELGVYNFTFIAGNCEGSDTFKGSFEITPFLSVEIGTDRIVNPSLPVNELLDAGNGFSSYLWNTGETTQSIVVNQVGDYHVAVQNNEGCTGADTLVVKYWDESTGYNAIQIMEKISVYPNPAGSVVNIVSEEKEIKMIRVFDANGKLIIEQQVNANSFKLQTENWNSGIYIIEIGVEDKKLNFRQAIIR